MNSKYCTCYKWQVNTSFTDTRTTSRDHGYGYSFCPHCYSKLKEAKIQWFRLIIPDVVYENEYIDFDKMSEGTRDYLRERVQND